MVRADVSHAPLGIAGIEGLVDTSEAGACVSFVERVRCHDAGREVSRLEYTSHPTADAEALRVAREVVCSSHSVHAVALSHRVGRLAVGEVAIVRAASADHRAQAFDACAHLVEKIKHELPVWKRQVFTDGNDEWVGSA
ncbi:molybdenum cofactor biosynthesis protein MoaE [Frankia sp. R43]|nr:molybdenum cofactor biosynthesis protein MoaE [Frankia sp. R43]